MGYKRYSPSEFRLLATLPEEGKKISTSDIIVGHYGSRKPRNARKSVNMMLRRLAKKAKENKEQFRIVMSDRNGPRDNEYWLERLNR